MKNREFGEMLLLMIKDQRSPVEIGKRAFSYAMTHGANMEGDLYNLCIRLNTMTLGDEFIIPYEELERISHALLEADDRSKKEM